MEYTSESSTTRAMEPYLISRRHPSSHEGTTRVKVSSALKRSFCVNMAGALQVSMAETGRSTVQRRHQKPRRAVEEEDGVGRSYVKRKGLV
ncbi:hypothetical protein TorRG33x02_026200 [Trema orientale]|uniref:Uncharacterized protein n=1 Tax=Trema orientale TaxID=63057 RepID=A0A2P5FVL3_TREOI|nr:hypothetical protein TorRG33x02_026200 [Trema orientale]